MRIISVAAPGNGSGKTLTLSAILSAFPGRLGAVKFTTVYRDGVNCPRTERACACRSLHGRFTVVTDPRVLAREDTDTGRLTAAGAKSVIWCLAQVGAHLEAWDHLRRELLGDQEDLITEGNTVIPVLNPDLVIMVISPRLPRARWKTDAWDLIRRADIVIINRHLCAADQLGAMVAEVTDTRGGVPPAVEDVSLPLTSWTDLTLLSRVSVLLQARPVGCS